MQQGKRGDGSGQGGKGEGQGRGQGGRGSIGKCVCPDCGATTPKQAGVPCNATKCPSCGKPMMRQTES